NIDTGSEPGARLQWCPRAEPQTSAPSIGRLMAGSSSSNSVATAGGAALQRTHSLEREHRNRQLREQLAEKRAAGEPARKVGELDPSYHIPKKDRLPARKESHRHAPAPPPPPHTLVGFRPPRTESAVTQQETSITTAGQQQPSVPTASPPRPSLPLLPFKKSKAQDNCDQFYSKEYAAHGVTVNPAIVAAEASTTATGRAGATSRTSTRTETPDADISLAASQEAFIMMPSDHTYAAADTKAGPPAREIDGTSGADVALGTGLRAGPSTIQAVAGAPEDTLLRSASPVPAATLPRSPLPKLIGSDTQSSDLAQPATPAVATTQPCGPPSPTLGPSYEQTGLRRQGPTAESALQSTVCDAPSGTAASEPAGIGAVRPEAFAGPRTPAASESDGDDGQQGDRPAETATGTAPLAAADMNTSTTASTTETERPLLERLQDLAFQTRQKQLPRYEVFRDLAVKDEVLVDNLDNEQKTAYFLLLAMRCKESGAGAMDTSMARSEASMASARSRKRPSMDDSSDM
ncbi:MAG: hypothetical protein FD187_3192, partial [bacterium]